jgi:phosphatidylglycerol lysyltransferase
VSDYENRVLETLRAYGDHATSFQILEPRYQYYFYELPDGPPAVVAWVPAGKYRAVAGIPVAPASQLAAVSEAFVEDALANKQHVLFFCADERFIHALGSESNLAFKLIPIGEQPEWNPQQWTIQGRLRRTVREQCNRAKNKGVQVRRVSAEELEEASTRSEIADVLQRWLDSRQMSSLSFLVDLQPFHCAPERRYYIAEAGRRAVGFLAAVPVYARDGWFFEDIIRVPDAPNGTAELLIHSAMRDARDAGDAWVTLGLSPLAGLDRTSTDNPSLLRLLHWVYKHGDPLYRFDGLKRFKSRFQPDKWSPQFIVQTPPGNIASALHAVLSAFAGGGLVSFALDTGRRMLNRLPLRFWALTLFALAALLVPWTVLLALADGQRWFGDESIQIAWVAFDTFLASALVVLGWLTWRKKRIAQILAIFLAGATITDFVLTAVQALNLHQDVSGWPSLFVLAGMLGPLSASLFLLTMYFVAPFPRPHRERRRHLGVWR